jgi:hypothetical protein
MRIDDGGSAFPNRIVKDRLSGVSISEQTGMSLRDYFIAHAPAEPQSWFRPVMETSRPVPVRVPGKDVLNETAIAAWDREESKQRYLQWPTAWADAMIAARRGRER